MIGMNHRRLIGSICTAALVAGLAAVAAPIGSASGVGAAPGIVEPGVSLAATDQVIVHYRSAGTALDAGALGRSAGQAVDGVRGLGGGSYVVKLSGMQSGAVLQRTLQAMARAAGVRSVEPDVRMFALATPDDPSFATQWDLAAPIAGRYGINAALAWDTTTGSAGIDIAVVDTGYLDHADLAGRFAPGYDFISDSLVANDGNGRDADAHDPGDWITSAENASGYFKGCGTSNSSWHGTHVAGTIGAATNNATGIAGINWVSQIVPVRVLGKCGGYTSDITDGVKWAAGLSISGVPANANPARVINLSLGGSGSCSSTWQSAINAVTAAGAVVVVAAGNSNANAANYSPASCAGVVTVASTGKAGNRAYYSNYGTSVEIAAPGGDKNADAGDTILSTLNTGTTVPGGDTYTKYQGTSMATPHVVGVVSLMLSVKPTLTPAQVTSLLQSSATAFPAGSTCSTSTCGAGILDAAAAVAAAAGYTPPPVPAPGAFGKSKPGNGATRVSRVSSISWAASANAAGYEYCIDTTIDGTCNGSWVSTGTSRSVTFVFASKTKYEWQVRATNTAGVTYANAGAWWTFTTR